MTETCEKTHFFTLVYNQDVVNKVLQETLYILIVRWQKDSSLLCMRKVHFHTFLRWKCRLLFFCYFGQNDDNWSWFKHPKQEMYISCTACSLIYNSNKSFLFYETLSQAPEKNLLCFAALAGRYHSLVKCPQTKKKREREENLICEHNTVVNQYVRHRQELSSRW